MYFEQTSKVEKQVAASIHRRCCRPVRIVSSCVDSNFWRIANIHPYVTFRTSRKSEQARLEISESVVEAKSRLQISAVDG